MLKPRLVLGIIPKVSKTKFLQIRNKKRLFLFKFQYQNGKILKSGTKFSGLQNGATRGLQIKVGFNYYKSGQEGLQIRVALGISNRGKEISNRGKKDLKSGQGLQLGQGLQICADQMLYTRMYGDIQRYYKIDDNQIR